MIADLAREGRTMILVTHEMKFAREVASHVVYLYNGLVEEEGPPEQIFGAPKSERLKQFLRNVALTCGSTGTIKQQNGRTKHEEFI